MSKKKLKVVKTARNTLPNESPPFNTSGCRNGRKVRFRPVSKGLKRAETVRKGVKTKGNS